MGLWGLVKSRSVEWYKERRSWELNEEARAEVRKLRALVNSRQISSLSPYEQELLEAANAELSLAESFLGASHRRAPIGQHVNAMRIHVTSARSLWMRSYVSNPEAVQPCLAGLREVVREHLSRNDERREKVEKIEVLQSYEDLINLVEAVEAAYAVALRDRLRLASFVRTVWCIAVLLLFLAVAVGALATRWPNAVPLCFTPLTTMPTWGQVDTAAPNYSMVCPLDSLTLDHEPETGDLAYLSTRGDYWVVELTGFVAAGIASGFSLRKIRGTASPYQVYVSLTALKLSTGALTALGGLTLMRGQFVPGLSALDTPAQIIAWAFVFGYSQEIFTQFVDKQGEKVLADVRGPGSAKQTPPAGGAASAPSQSR